jgi:GTPase-activating protein
MEEIKKDVNRTFPDHYFFAEKDGYGQKALTRVLQALSLTYKDMGYCQGLNYICALLVLYCNDEV